MYFPYFRGRQFELIALRELVGNSLLSKKVIPVIEPVKLSSTIINTIRIFEENERKMGIIVNPQVGGFCNELNKGKNSMLKERFEKAMESPAIIATHILNAHSKEELAQERTELHKLITICQNKDYIPAYENIFSSIKPQFNLILDESVFRRKIKDNKVLLDNKFKKRDRNSDYADNIDEPFSEDHLYYEDDGYIGFSDYSVIGDEYIESGFAPYAVAIHIVYFDKEKSLRIRHFVSDTNDDISDPAKKFEEAVGKLVNWNKQEGLNTTGIRTFEHLYNEEMYPGLGTVKKLSIMHHLELMSRYLDKATAR